VPIRALRTNEGAGDRELVEGHKAGDTDAFAAIVKTYHAGLVGHAVRRLGDPQAAEDAVQEALLRAYRALPRFNGEYRLGPWLHRILDNVCADEGNRRRRDLTLRSRLEALPPGADQAPDQGPELSEAVAALPEQYQEALYLRFVEGLPYREMAASTGISEENARARVHRARAALKKVVTGAATAVAAFAALARRTPRVAEAATLGRSASVHGVAAELVVHTAAAPDRLLAASKVAAAVVAVALPVASVSLAVAPPPAPPPGAGFSQVEAVAAPAAMQEFDVPELPSESTAGPVDGEVTFHIVAAGSPSAPVSDAREERAAEPDAAREPATESTKPSTKEAADDVKRDTSESAPETEAPTPTASSAEPRPAADDRPARRLELPAPRVDDSGAAGRTDVTGSGTLSVNGAILSGRFSFTITAPDPNDPTAEQRLLGSFIGSGTRLRFYGTLVQTEDTNGVAVHRFEGTYRRYGAELDGLPAKGEFSALYSAATDGEGRGLYVEIRPAVRSITAS
jgi:RNA polymerase sigma-70 factor, ECF subfamily